VLNRNASLTFKCPFDWARYRGKNATISITTVQNYTVSYTKTTLPSVEITQAIFNVADTNNFNITVHNSALYYTSVQITEITLTFENGTTKQVNGTTVTPALPITLSPGTSGALRCPWNWIDYQGRNVTITVKTSTSDAQVAKFVKLTPKRVYLTITRISFDTINTGVFEISLRNSALSIEHANITRITITFENGTIKEVPSIAPLLPYLLGPNTTSEFTCQWDWSNYRVKNITITIHALKENGTTEYLVSSLYTTPAP
jgi:ribosome maturation factor RimP